MVFVCFPNDYFVFCRVPDFSILFFFFQVNPIHWIPNSSSQTTIVDDANQPNRKHSAAGSPEVIFTGYRRKPSWRPRVPSRKYWTESNANRLRRSFWSPGSNGNRFRPPGANNGRAFLISTFSLLHFFWWQGWRGGTDGKISQWRDAYDASIRMASTGAAADESAPSFIAGLDSLY